MFSDQEWHPTGAALFGPEDFYPKRHVRWEEWGDGLRRRPRPYPSIPDYWTLGVEPADRASFWPTRLCHVTRSDGAQGIVTNRDLRSEALKRLGEEMEERFSWWSFEINKGEIEREKTRYQEINQVPEAQDILREFFNSPAFQDESRYGNFRFTYDIQALVGAYRDSVCHGERPEFRVLGTFRYKQEIMHAVVVLPPDDVPSFQDCPQVPDDPNAVVSVSKQGWRWRPDSTGNHNHERRYRRWDHVGFAFFLPPEECQFTLPAGNPPLTYCKVAEPNLSGSDPVSEKKFSKLLNTWDVSN